MGHTDIKMSKLYTYFFFYTLDIIIS